MKKPEIAKRLVRQSGESQGEAADRLDRVVRQIVSKLRRGEEAPLPGLGKFTVGEDGRVTFEHEKERGRG
jgi:nucleoid DNA-binding protein